MILYPDTGSVRPAILIEIAVPLAQGSATRDPVYKDVCFRRQARADHSTVPPRAGPPTSQGPADVDGPQRVRRDDDRATPERSSTSSPSGPRSAGTGVGTTGYCMGGRASLLAAGNHPDRVVAAASFHGGRLAATDDPDSPYLLADRMRATVYVAAAENDALLPARSSWSGWRRR